MELRDKLRRLCEIQDEITHINENLDWHEISFEEEEKFSDLKVQREMIINDICGDFKYPKEKLDEIYVREWER